MYQLDFGHFVHFTFDGNVY